jgi:hypothetical protein
MSIAHQIAVYCYYTLAALHDARILHGGLLHRIRMICTVWRSLHGDR